MQFSLMVSSLGLSFVYTALSTGIVNLLSLQIYNRSHGIVRNKYHQVGFDLFDVKILLTPPSPSVLQDLRTLNHQQ